LKKSIISNQYKTGGRLVLSFYDVDGNNHVIVEEDYCVMVGKGGMPYRCHTGDAILPYPKFKAGSEINIMYQKSKNSNISNFIYNASDLRINFKANDVVELENGGYIDITDSAIDYDIIYESEEENICKKDIKERYKLIYLTFAMSLIVIIVVYISLI
jgi:hypothetical protein